MPRAVSCRWLIPDKRTSIPVFPHTWKPGLMRSSSFTRITTRRRSIGTATLHPGCTCSQLVDPIFMVTRTTDANLAPSPCRWSIGFSCAMPPRMPDLSAPAIRVRDVQKDYHTLRPLRVRVLDVHEGESIALLGFDRAGAEVFVNLLTAATVPDAGRIEIFGRPTVDIQDADTWLSSLDCFGIVSERQVLIDNMTVEENLTMPLTIALHDVEGAVRAKVTALAEEVGLSSDLLRQPVTALDAGSRLRV